MTDKTLPQLLPGQRLSREEFIRRWEAMPALKRAELIGGLVYTPSPVSLSHADHDSLAGTWLGGYSLATPGTRASTSASWFILADAPQPDSSLRILPEYGGRTKHNGKYGSGAPELLLEICLSSADQDLHEKLDLYRDGAVQEYIAVLVETKEVRWHRLETGQYRLLSREKDGTSRSIVFPGLWLDPQALLNLDSAAVWSTLQEGLQTPEHAAFVAELARRRSTLS
jgi:Uma2 family endonuclease